MIDLKNLNIDQKIKLLIGSGAMELFNLDGVVPSIMASDASCGLRYTVTTSTTHTRDDNGAPRVVEQKHDEPNITYPSSNMLANSWDLDIAKIMGKALAEDCIEKDVDVLLGPGLNIKRTPLCGRNFEYYSEDPYLSGHIAKAYVEGMQSKGVCACVKHYIANNSEDDRLWKSSEIDERTLREIYLTPFEIALQANPLFIMSSYNMVNGVWMSEHKKLYDLLKNELGFNGLIVSDWGAVSNHVASVNAGLNIQMPYRAQFFDTIKQAVADGKITEETIDSLVKKNLEIIDLIQKNKSKHIIETTKEERCDISQKIAEAGIVLLKNQDNILPLNNTQNILVSGFPANSSLSGGGACYVVPYKNPVDLRTCLEKALNSDKVSMDLATRCSFNDVGGNNAYMGFKACLEKASNADIAVVTVGTGIRVEYEGTDRRTLKLTKEQEDLILETCKVNDNVVVCIYAGSAIDMSAWIDKVKAVVYVGFAGIQGHEAVANILSGKVNPSGKLSETFPYSLQDVPATKTYDDAFVSVYSEGLNVGYRYYATHNIKTLFPFGYGLSYSNFEYSNLVINKLDDLKYEVKFDITNTSSVVGAEIAQVYVRDVISNVYRPKFELKGFDKKQIKPNETVTFSIVLDERAFAFYSTAKDCWTVENGKFEILVGASSDDIRLKQNIVL
ncbi:MAG: glycoside hydrolase family 3 C-terminal domain-containing protein [Clostridia bacterium]|nr:glycoside hydrolase family 3 C-terminal domain-containing protein [Clostridia bacterium]